jgi:hypothetical protein
MELAGLEPATSWVRCVRSCPCRPSLPPSPHFFHLPAGGRGAHGGSSGRGNSPQTHYTPPPRSACVIVVREPGYALLVRAPE